MNRSVILLFALLTLGNETTSGQGPVFDALHQMFPPGNGTVCFATGDVDGDGDLDVLAGSYTQNRLYLNEGTGKFRDVTPTSLPSLSDKTWALALGDMDGDGDLDAFVGNDGQNRLYLNDGSGAFTDMTVVYLPSRNDGTRGLALGDVDGDGDLDALIGNRENDYLVSKRLYLNDGQGVFTDTPAQLPSAPSAATSVGLVDVDGDGDLDIVASNDVIYPYGNCAMQQNDLHLNDGAGYFADASNFLPPHTDATQDIALGDVDGDGDLDARVANERQCGNSFVTNRLYVNNGAGVFSDVTASNLPSDMDASSSIALGDVDGDGDLDALVGNLSTSSSAEGAQNCLYLNSGNGVFIDATTTHLPAILDRSHGVALVDVDGDSDLDLVVANGNDDMLLLNDGMAHFVVASWNMPILDERSRDAALVDVDADGDLDVMIAVLHCGTPDRLFLNDGDGIFHQSPHVLPAPPTADATCCLALGDVDGDGDPDALLGARTASSGPSPNRLHLNDGTGVFADGTNQLPALADRSMAVAMRDMDGDGDLDALLCNYAEQDRLWLNDGNGFFSDVTTTHLPADSDVTWGLALGDVDNDGDLDALMVGGSQNRLYLNTGLAVFGDVTATHMPAVTDASRSVALGDVDGDGDIDALIGNFDEQDRLYLNDGSGHFNDATAQIPTDSDRTIGIAMVDVDLDGDLDAFLAGTWYPYPRPNRLYMNDGSGGFSCAPQHLPLHHDVSVAVAFGDLDTDGDLDAVIANSGQSRIYYNLTRQLAWRNVPCFGRSLTLEIHGPVGEPWVLGAAIGKADISSPGWGTLRLDPTSLLVLDSGIIGSQGHDSVTYQIGADPGGAASITVYGQLLVGISPRLTNLETFSLTTL